MKYFKMNHKSLVLATFLLLIVATLASGIPALAQSGGYDLSWWTVSGGGVTGQTGAGGYSLGGTSGQPSAAVWAGGNYSLSGGFWVGSALEDYAIYLPILLRNG